MVLNGVGAGAITVRNGGAGIVRAITVRNGGGNPGWPGRNGRGQRLGSNHVTAFLNDKGHMDKGYMDKEYMNELTWLKSKSVSAPPSLRTRMFMWIPGSSSRTCTL